MAFKIRYAMLYTVRLNVTFNALYLHVENANNRTHQIINVKLIKFIIVLNY